MTLDTLKISLPLEDVRAYCRQQPIGRLALFGSALRDDFSPISDVDLLVDYQPGARVTLLDMAQQDDQIERGIQPVVRA